ncbi:MAG: hypothetical protein F6K35_34160 [Okeania sp. SIO2H7]|nr:hypothetical protein [Okeania sp. SIO2H7]
MERSGTQHRKLGGTEWNPTYKKMANVNYLEKYGQFPWRRDRYAQLLEAQDLRIRNENSTFEIASLLARENRNGFYLCLCGCGGW